MNSFRVAQKKKKLSLLFVCYIIHRFQLFIKCHWRRCWPIIFLFLIQLFDALESVLLKFLIYFFEMPMKNTVHVLAKLSC